MRNNSIAPRQLWAWLAVGMSAPLAHWSGAGWLTALVTAAAVLPLSALGAKGWADAGKWISAAGLIWIVAVLASLIPESGEYWPGNQNERVVPLALIVLAALSAGGEKAARVGSVLFWVLVLVYAPVVLGASAGIEWEYLAETGLEWAPGLIAVLTVPALAGLWQEEGAARNIAPLGILAVAFAGITQGMLSIAACEMDTPFYEVGRSLRLGGMSRFEPLIAVAVTFGWYCFASFLLSAAAQLGSRIGWKEPWGIWGAGGITAALVLFDVQFDHWILAIGGTVLWILLPIISLQKNLKKDEKRY